MLPRIDPQLSVMSLVGSVLLLGPAFIPASAQGESLLFSGTDEGGTGSAFVDIDITGNTLTWTMDNTSPTTLNSPLSGDNAPGIVGFGFDLLDPLPSLLSWSLTAYTDSGLTTAEIVGGNPDSGLDTWELGTTIAGVTLDFLPEADVGGVKGAIYNPAASSAAFAAPPNYFSTATLVMNFDSSPVLAPLPASTFVRMQNVGLGGEGSLKLFGTPTVDTDVPAVPEPASAVLFGMGMVCGSGLAIRRRKKKPGRSG